MRGGWIISNKDARIRPSIDVFSLDKVLIRYTINASFLKQICKGITFK